MLSTIFSPILKRTENKCGGKMTFFWMTVTNQRSWNLDSHPGTHILLSSYSDHYTTRHQSVAHLNEAVAGSLLLFCPLSGCSSFITRHAAYLHYAFVHFRKRCSSLLFWVSQFLARKYHLLVKKQTSFLQWSQIFSRAQSLGNQTQAQVLVL